MPRRGAPPGMKEDRLGEIAGRRENERPSYEYEREPEAVSGYLFAPPVVALFTEARRGISPPRPGTCLLADHFPLLNAYHKEEP
jgi:hypothetical protein